LVTFFVQAKKVTRSLQRVEALASRPQARTKSLDGQPLGCQQRPAKSKQESRARSKWIPAFAGMKIKSAVIEFPPLRE
jgi:hypothetical protein